MYTPWEALEEKVHLLPPRNVTYTCLCVVQQFPLAETFHPGVKLPKTQDVLKRSSLSLKNKGLVSLMDSMKLTECTRPSHSRVNRNIKDCSADTEQLRFLEGTL